MWYVNQQKNHHGEGDPGNSLQRQCVASSNTFVHMRSRERRHDGNRDVRGMEGGLDLRAVRIGRPTDSMRDARACACENHH